jgi:hypothetical protein
LVIAETRQSNINSRNLVALWALFLASPSPLRENTSKVGIWVPSVLQAFINPGKLIKALKAVIRYRSAAPHAAILYKRVLQSRSGLLIGKMDNDNMHQLRTKDKRINLYISEMGQ